MFKLFVFSSISTASLLFGKEEVPPSTDFIKQNAIEIPAPLFIPSIALQEFRKYKIILVGEIHGSNETPKFVSGLAQSLATKQQPLFVGLEIPSVEQKAIQKFLNSGDDVDLKHSPFFTRKPAPEGTQDGRSSEAMAQLLANIRGLPNVTVFCFDPADDKPISGQERDSGMAKNILETIRLNQNAKFLILAGNIHASISQGYPEHPEYLPMGYQLHSTERSPIKKSDLLAIKVRFAGGASWVSMDGEDGSHLFLPSSSVFSTAVGYENYILFHDPYEGYTAALFLNQTSSSVPFLASVLKYPRLEKFLAEYDSLLARDHATLNRWTLDLQNKDAVKKRLAQMFVIDQKGRFAFNYFGDSNFSDEERAVFLKRQQPRMRQIDKQNVEELKPILAQYGWLKRSEFGDKTDNDAWLLVQHMDFDVAFQKSVLSTLEKLYPIHETRPMNYAYLYDRVATNEGRLQRYGSQGTCTGEGAWEPKPMEDPGNVDKRRAAMEMESMEQYRERFKLLCHKY